MSWPISRRAAGTPLCLAVALAVYPMAKAHGETVLAVDFGVADIGTINSITPNDVQAGFDDFSIDPEFAFGDRDSVNVGAFTESRTFAGIEVHLSGSANGPTITDYGTDVSHPLGDLTEDVARVVQGNVRVELLNLSAGMYTMTTFHHDAGLTAAPLPFDITLDTGGGPATVASDVATSFGLAPSTISSESFPFVADGASPVTLELVGGGQFPDLISPVLNGFTVQTVPEPAAIVLLLVALPAIGFGLWRRWLSRRDWP